MSGIICSVIIAARNEEAFIGNCIESLENQELDSAKYEIIIIDGLSEDNTVDIIKKMQTRYDNIVLTSNPKKIAAPAFNRGIGQSSGKYVFIVGAHAEYPPDFLSKSLYCIEANNTDCVGGREIDTGKSKLGKVFAAVRNTSFGGGLSPYRYSDKKQFVKTVAFGCYKREALIRAGGFDEALVKNQDNDLNRRIIENGGEILFDPSISFFYFVRDSIKGIIRQMFGYGCWEAKLIIKRKSELSIAALVPAFFVVYTLLAVMLLFLYGTALPLCLEFVPYLILFAYFAVKSIIPKRLNLLTALLLYLLIHFSIGLGFIDGLIFNVKG